MSARDEGRSQCSFKTRDALAVVRLIAGPFPTLVIRRDALLPNDVLSEVLHGRAWLVQALYPNSIFRILLNELVEPFACVFSDRHQPAVLLLEVHSKTLHCPIKLAALAVFSQHPSVVLPVLGRDPPVWRAIVFAEFHNCHYVWLNLEPDLRAHVGGVMGCG